MNRDASVETRVLFVDDSPNLLGAVRRTLRGKAQVQVAEGAQEALDVLDKDPNISIVVTDQNMPGMKGIEFLAVVAERWPLVTRVMQTGNNDQDTAISAIRQGRVFRFLRKPYSPDDLFQVIVDAQAEHNIRKAEHALLENTLAGSVKLMTEMLSLMRPDLYAQSTRVHELTKTISTRLHMSQPWELALAALLYPLGLATVPKDILDKRKSGVRLSEPESFAIAQSGVAAGQLVAKIPKLERVATYLRYSRKGRDGSGLPPLEDDLDTPQNAIYLLPLLIDIVELSDIRDISLRDAAMALRDDPKYNVHLLSVTIDELMKRAKTQEQERVVKDVSIGEIRVGDILINDLRGESGELLLTGGSQLTDLLLKRLRTLSENRTIPKSLTIGRAA